MNLYTPVFLDCNDCKVNGKWFIKAKDAYEAFDIAKSKLSNSKISSYLYPHGHFASLVDVKVVEFTDGIYLIDSKDRRG